MSDKILEFGIDKLKAIVDVDMTKVNQLIIERAVSDVELIPIITDYLVSSGGKRIRPMLTIASSMMFGYKGSDHIKLATCVEFMHTATLLHDDVVDRSDQRRGKKTARLLWGNQASVLVGDYLLGIAFEMMVEVGSVKALKVLSSAATIIAEGEVMQLAATNNIMLDKSQYYKIINSKTAALFSAATEVGAILSKKSDIDCKAMSSFGTNMGIAFQLIDDILDYEGDEDKTGKELGDDFAEGKITLPIIIANEKASDEEKGFLYKCFNDKNRENGDLQKTIEIINKYDAIDETRKIAFKYGNKAIDELSIFPQSKIKEALISIVKFAIKRKH